MTTANDPRLAAALRRYREGRCISGDAVAAALRWSPSKMSRIERGRTGISRADLDRLTGYYQTRGMPPAQAAALAALHDEATARAHLTSGYLGPAALAAEACEWAPGAVPRLLQTRDYTRALLAGLAPAVVLSPGEIRDRCDAIALWQARLTADPPLRYRAVLDAAVLTRDPGGVLRDQLERLAAADTAGPDTEVRVLPAPEAGALAAVPAFTWLGWPPPGDESAIMTDDLDGPAWPALAERETWQRRLVFTALWDAADPAGPAVKAALAALLSRLGFRHVDVRAAPAVPARLPGQPVRYRLGQRGRRGRRHQRVHPGQRQPGRRPVAGGRVAPVVQPVQRPAAHLQVPPRLRRVQRGQPPRGQLPVHPGRPVDLQVLLGHAVPGGPPAVVEQLPPVNREVPHPAPVHGHRS